MLKMADIVVTEAGFGADLGAEKFFDIKCRKAGLNPEAAVIVATVRALKMHGGVAREDLGTENLEALREGLANLDQHIANINKFGVPPIVGINRFHADTDAELELVKKHCEAQGVPAYICTHWADGGAGTEDIARKVVEVLETGDANFKPLYPDEMPLWEKIQTVAKEIYRADGATAEARVINQIKDFEDAGFGNFPVCMAKTQYSFSADATLRGAPRGLRFRSVKFDCRPVLSSLSLLPVTS